MSAYQEYNKEQIQQLVDEIDLLQYASSTFEFIKRGGGSYACSCPLHKDNTPSLIITPSKNRFYCQSCKRGGTIIEWLMTYEHLSFEGAISKMQKISGHSINLCRVSQTVKVFKQYNQIINKPILKTNTESREILSKTYYLQTFDDLLPQEWLDEGIAPEELKKYEIRIDVYGNRIVYPVYDKEYNLIGVKGRTRLPDYKEMHIQKYMNYNKIMTTDFFTGMKQAEEYIKSSLQIIIVEGIKSVMKIDGWGYHNVVSSETSDINIAQIIILLQLRVKEVIIAFDKDISIDRIKSVSKKIKQYANVYAVIDNNNLLDEKMSPCDKGKGVWETLLNARVKI